MLYDRIINEGTVDEPRGKPKPAFALPAAVNWMHALRILVEASGIDYPLSKNFYIARGVGKRTSITRLEENTVLEQLFLALHHLSALDRMRIAEKAADHARVGVLAWYYGLTNAARGMTAAQSGSFQEDHAGTAKVWDKQIAKAGFAIGPFGWRVSCLVESTFKPEVEKLKSGSNGTLQSRPSSSTEAQSAAAEYLSGSAKWYAWKACEDLKRSPQFKQLGVGDFRTKKARDLRDQLLKRKAMGFIHQASRFRGKANYREALFLAHGKGTEAILATFGEDMFQVLKSFVAMSGAFAARKLGATLWEQFITEVDENRAFSLSASSVWS